MNAVCLWRYGHYQISLWRAAVAVQQQSHPDPPVEGEKTELDDMLQRMSDEMKNRPDDCFYDPIPLQMEDVAHDPFETMQHHETFPMGMELTDSVGWFTWNGAVH